MKAFFSLLTVLLFPISFQVQAQSVKTVPYHSMLQWDTSPYKSYRFTGRTNSAESWINFRLLFPSDYDSTAKDGKKYPLIIVLHGTGESARMEWNNSTRTNTPYPTGDKRIDNNDHHLLFGGQQHLNAMKNGQYQGFVLFPQNFYGTWIKGNGSATSEMYRDMEITLELLEYLIGKLKIDPNRIIIEGISNGGVGAWYAAYRRPDLFAALIPMSAQGDPAMAPTLAHLPIWVFQGQIDTNPTPRSTEETVNAIRNAGGNIKYTLYPETGHNTWNKAYQEPDFFKWILAQKRPDPSLNKMPIVDAGSRQIVLLPKDSTLLEGTASDEDGTVKGVRWEKISGPKATIHSPLSSTTKVTGLEEGEYVFRFTATDNFGARGTGDLRVIVSSKPLAASPEESKELNAALYPNPFSDFIRLKITSDKASDVLVTFFNSQGKQLYQTGISLTGTGEQLHTISFENNPLPAGIYFVQIAGKGINSLRKLTVVKN